MTMARNNEAGDVFANIADDLQQHGYSIQTHALPAALTRALLAHLQQQDTHHFTAAGIGRGQQHNLDPVVRQDRICWIDGRNAAEQQWLDWAEQLKLALNQRLFLGLFSYESHFAHYPPGAFYKKHRDAFRGETNRVLSTVAYLNPDWQTGDGGELLIYHPQDDTILARVAPQLATLVVFLSEEFPHEVLPARRDRHSIAGWFRVNGSAANLPFTNT
jgi:SM-20-related protein